LAALPLLTTPLALGGDGYWDHWNEGGSCCGDPGIGSDGYKAGIADAVYDHQNNLSYHPLGNCLPCHSQEYWNNFREGYQHQWDTYQSTHQTVNNYVTVNGNGNDVNINNHQSSDQLSSQEPWNSQPQGCCGVTGPGEDP